MQHRLGIKGGLLPWIVAGVLAFALFLSGSSLILPATGAAPNAATLGVPIYPGAKYDEGLSKHYNKIKAISPSPKGTFAFTTADSVQKVAAFYRKNAKFDQQALEFHVMEFPLQASALSADDFGGAVRNKAEASLKSNANKTFAQTVEMAGTTHDPRNIVLYHPYLTPQGDLVDQTLILVQYF